MSTSDTEREFQVDTIRDSSRDTSPDSSRDSSPNSYSDSSLIVEARVNQYEMIRELGRGGMSRVFLARDTKLGRLVAIKFLISYSHGPIDRVLREARATARCHHDNIVVIHEVSEHRGVPYMVFEYLEGQTLGTWMHGRNMSVSSAVETVVPIVRALCCAHALGIVHRDLKPDNVILTKSGAIKVLDFGIAKLLSHREMGTAAVSGDRDQQLDGIQDLLATGDGNLIGTLPYMSPEQLGADEVDHRADIWAVGIILYEMVTGQHPVAPITPDRLVEVADLDAPMPSISKLKPGLSAISAIVDRCLRKRKSERYATAQDLLAELEQLLPSQQTNQLNENDCPYAGLTSFQESDADRFFGRSRDIAGILTRMREQPLVGVVGPSGVGKSSFVRAGVVPALKRSNESWDVHLVRPGRHPVAALAGLVSSQFLSTAAVATMSMDLLSERDAILERLRREPGYLGADLRSKARKNHNHVLLFIDHFEELYTHVSDPGERAAFTACLEGAADDATAPLRVIIAMRSDFLDRVAEDRRFMNMLSRGLMFLPPLGRKDLQEALMRPLEAVGYRFETPAIVDNMLDILGSARGALPLLQFTASQLWERRDRSRRMLTQASYRDVGGVAGTLSRHADAVLANLSPPARSLAGRLLLCLVTPERTRAVVGLDEIYELFPDRQEIAEVIDQLITARLLVIESSGDMAGPTIELAHESMIDSWPTLRCWLDETQADAAFLARLRVAAKQWQAHDYAEGMLWRDETMREAMRFQKRYRGELSATEAQYLRAVIALAGRAVRRRRLMLAAIGGALIVIAMVTGSFAWRERVANRRMYEAYARSQQDARQARDATRVAVARDFADDPTTELALLREVEEPAQIRSWVAEATRVLSFPIARTVFRGHAARLTAAAIAPDGTRVITASRDKTAQIWDAAGLEATRVLEGHSGVIWSVAFSPDGTRVATGGDDWTARVWPADGSGETVVLRGHSDEIGHVAFSPDGTRVLTASNDWTARLWYLDNSNAPVVFRGHEDVVVQAVFSPNGKRVATASADTTVRVWNARGRGAPVVLTGHTGAVHAVAFSPDGRRVATASHDHTARIWRANGRGEPIVLQGHTGAVRSVAFSADGRRVITAADDQTARVWQSDGSSDPVLLSGHTGAVQQAEFSPDGSQVVTASADSTARVWNADGSGTPMVIEGHILRLSRAVFSPDGAHLVTISDDRTARVWDMTTDAGQVVLGGHPSGSDWAVFSPDGLLLATTAGDNTVRVWNADGSSKPVVLPGHTDRIYNVAFSPEGRRLVTASADNTARVWHVDGSSAPVVLQGHRGAVYHAAFSPGGTRVVTASADNTARVWNPDGSGVPILLDGHGASVRWAAFSPDGTQVATVSDDTSVRIWDPYNASEIAVLRGHTKAVLSVAYSPDGTRVVTASADNTARIWNPGSGSRPVVLRGHADWVWMAVFSPDGQQVLTASDDWTARVWGADSSGGTTVFRGHAGPITWATFSPDGDRVLTASNDKTARIWRVDSSQTPIVLRGHRGSVQRAGFSPDGARVVTTSTDGTARIWMRMQSIESLHERLWRATSYCLPLADRIYFLAVDEKTAAAGLKRCHERVAQTR